MAKAAHGDVTYLNHLALNVNGCSDELTSVPDDLLKQGEDAANTTKINIPLVIMIVIFVFKQIGYFKISWCNDNLK